jgi:hypothetical protein
VQGKGGDLKVPLVHQAGRLLQGCRQAGGSDRATEAAMEASAGVLGAAAATDMSFSGMPVDTTPAQESDQEPALEGKLKVLQDNFNNITGAIAKLSNEAVAQNPALLKRLERELDIASRRMEEESAALGYSSTNDIINVSFLAQKEAKKIEDEVALAKTSYEPVNKGKKWNPFDNTENPPFDEDAVRLAKIQGLAKRIDPGFDVDDMQISELLGRYTMEQVVQGVIDAVKLKRAQFKPVLE